MHACVRAIVSHGVYFFHRLHAARTPEMMKALADFIVQVHTGSSHTPLACVAQVCVHACVLVVLGISNHTAVSFEH